MSWFGSNKEEVDEVLRKIEQIMTEKTQRLSFIEESLHGLAEQLAQPSCTAELESLRTERDKAEEEALKWQEENLNLRKQLLELRRSDKSPAITEDEPRQEQHNTQNEQLPEQLSQSQQQLKLLEEQLQSTRSELESKSAELKTLATLAEQCAAERQEIKMFRDMQQRFFPDCIMIPALEPFLAEWRVQFTADEPDYRVLSMFSYLFSWSSLLENAKRNPDSLNSNVEKEAISAIAYFSRYFLEALYTKGSSPEDAQNISLELIERFNNVLSSVGTKHQLFVPYLGESYDNKTMMPDGNRGNTFGVVEALLSWGVHNPEAEISYSKCQVQLS